MEENNALDAASQLRDHLTKHRISQSLAARSCGVSAAALSQWMAGTYAGNSEVIESKVRDYLVSFAERRKQSGLENHPLVNTRNFESVQRFLNICLTRQIIGLLVGDAGFGKTTAIRDFATKHPNAILIEADMGYTPTVFFNEISGEFGIDCKMPLHDKFLMSIEKLKDTGRLLIIDEAEHLPVETLEYVRKLHDKAGIGIAMCGMRELEAGVFNNRSKFLQLSSRVSIIRRLERLKKDDIKTILEQTAPIDEDAFELLTLKSKGNNRILSQVSIWLKEGLKQQKAETITKEIAQAAIDMVPAA